MALNCRTLISAVLSVRREDKSTPPHAGAIAAARLDGPQPRQPFNRSVGVGAARPLELHTIGKPVLQGGSYGFPQTQQGAWVRRKSTQCRLSTSERLDDRYQSQAVTRYGH